MKPRTNSLAEYAVTASSGDWKPYPYLHRLADYIIKKIAKGNARLIISMPPRHGKSMLLSYWLPRFYLEAEPSNRIILSTYSDQFATKWGRQVRNALRESEWHKAARLASDAEAASNFYTTEGGGMLAAGIKGGITGEGADLLLADDLLKNWEQAQSMQVRDSINSELEATLNTRLEPNASVVMLMTRWHSHDPAGFAEDRYNWEFLRFPAIADELSFENNPLDRREIGEALNPDRYPIEKLKEIKSNMSSRMWQSLYQQTPVDEQEHSLWSYEMFQRTDIKPRDLQNIVIAIDPAVTNTQKSDETGIIAAGKRGEKYYILEDATIKGSPAQWANRAIALYREYEADYIVAEVNQGGDMVEATIRNVDPAVSYDEVRATRGKRLRAEPIVGLYENGRVYHCKQFDQLESQMVRFAGQSTSESPDRMDSLVWGLSYLSGDHERQGSISALT